MSNIDTQEIVPTPTTLVAGYIDVVNEALAGRSPWSPQLLLVEVGEKILGDRPIDIAVESRDALGTEVESEHHTARLVNGKFVYEKSGAPHGDRGVRWPIDRRHLEAVRDEPRKYVASPLRLQLDWLKSRIVNDDRLAS